MNDKSANYFLVKVRFRIMQYFKHLHSDSGVDRTSHTQDTAARACTGIRIEIIENTMFGLIQFSVYTFARLIE